jgi:hypothetical protein
MHHDQIILGQWEEVSRRHSSELKGHRVEIRVLDQTARSSPPRMIFEGMFPQLAAISEEDFAKAEWRGPKDVDV